jgi:hypothetical protein
MVLQRLIGEHCALRGKDARPQGSEPPRVANDVVGNDEEGVDIAESGGRASRNAAEQDEIDDSIRAKTSCERVVQLPLRIVPWHPAVSTEGSLLTTIAGRCIEPTERSDHHRWRYTPIAQNGVRARMRAVEVGGQPARCFGDSARSRVARHTPRASKIAAERFAQVRP